MTFFPETTNISKPEAKAGHAAFRAIAETSPFLLD
jgi:hypothetical protein